MPRSYGAELFCRSRAEEAYYTNSEDFDKSSCDSTIEQTLLDVDPHVRKFHLDFKEYFEGRAGGGVAMIANSDEHSATLIWLHDGGEEGSYWLTVTDKIALEWLKFLFPNAPPVRARQWFEVADHAVAANSSDTLRYEHGIYCVEDKESLQRSVDYILRCIDLEIRNGIEPSRGSGKEELLPWPLRYSANTGWEPSLRSALGSRGREAEEKRDDGRLQTPIHMLHGEDDPELPPMFVNYSANQLHGARLKIRARLDVVTWQHADFETSMSRCTTISNTSVEYIRDVILKKAPKPPGSKYEYIPPDQFLDYSQASRSTGECARHELNHQEEERRRRGKRGSSKGKIAIRFETWRQVIGKGATARDIGRRHSSVTEMQDGVSKSEDQHRSSQSSSTSAVPPRSLLCHRKVAASLFARFLANRREGSRKKESSSSVESDVVLDDEDGKEKEDEDEEEDEDEDDDDDEDENEEDEEEDDEEF
eukprot:768320-Hanusia_phi.AAC.13